MGGGFAFAVSTALGMMFCRLPMRGRLKREIPASRMWANLMQAMHIPDQDNLYLTTDPGPLVFVDLRKAL